MKVISVKCKPYVKRFLEMEYGKPLQQGNNQVVVKLSEGSAIGAFFLCLLQKKSERYDKRYSRYKLEKFSQSVEIRVSDSHFYRYGWELSFTNTVKFGRFVEDQVKNFMREDVARKTIFFNLKDAILQFQKEYGFCEEVWPYESIRKHIDRTGRFRNQTQNFKTTCLKLYNNIDIKQVKLC